MIDEPSHKCSLTQSHVLTFLLRMRQVCCHPVLIKSMLDKNEAPDDDEDIKNDGSGNNSIDLISQMASFKPDDEANAKEEEDKFFSHDNPIFNRNYVSSKMKFIVGEVKKVVEQNHKAVVVSQWTSYLNLFSNHFRMMDIRTHRIDGSTPLQKRQEIVEDFNTNPKGPPVLFFCFNIPT